MKKSLDDYFKSQLKDQCNIPEDIVFNQELVKQRIMDKIVTHRPHSYWRTAAMLLIIVGLSSLCLYQQSRLAMYKKSGDFSTPLVSIKETLSPKTDLLTEPKRNIVEALSLSQNKRVEPMRYIPRIEAKMNIVTNIYPMVKCKVPVYIFKNENNQSAMAKPAELDLQVYYESDKLAVVNENTTKVKPLFQKLQRLIDN